MFQTLLSPLRSRFDLSPRSPTFPVPESATTPRSPFTSGSFGSFGSALGAEQEAAPEEFARDVLIQLMSNAVEDMKIRGAESSEGGLRGRIEVCFLVFFWILLVGKLTDGYRRY